MAHILLDTHVALFALAEPNRLGSTARALIVDPENHVYFSPISVWEVAIKHAKHPEDMPVSARQFTDFCLESGYRELRLEAAQACELELLDEEGAPIHSDPFDRMLLCQARKAGALLLTRDKKLLAYSDACIVSAR